MNRKIRSSLALAAGVSLLLLMGAAPGAVAQEAECKAGGLSNPLIPYPSSATKIGSRLSCDSIIDPQDGVPYVGCDIAAGDFDSNGEGECSYVDGDKTVTVTAMLGADGVLSFEATDENGDPIPWVNNMFSEGTTGSNYCNFSWPAGTAWGEGLYFQKKGGAVSGLRNASFCSGGENLAGVIPKDEEDVDNMCDPETGDPGNSDVAALRNALKDLGYSALLFNTADPSKVGTCIIDEETGGPRTLYACIDRCEPCDRDTNGDVDDPACPQYDQGVSLDCKISGNWSCPGGDCDGFEADPGLLGQAFCWETVSSSKYSGIWVPPMMRHNWNFQLQATETNPTSGWGSWGGGAWTW